MTELIKQEDITPALFYNSEIGKIVDQIILEAGSIAIDTSTQAGRNEAISLAYKVRQSKAFIEQVGKEAVAEIKEKAKHIDSQRKDARDRLDHLAEEIRRPVTEFENLEKERLAGHKTALEKFSLLLSHAEFAGSTSQQIGKLVEQAIELLDSRDWEEFADDALFSYNDAVTKLSRMKVDAQKHESDMAELEKLRKEKEERDRIEREERIRKQAEETAKAEAEAKIKKAEQERIDAEKRLQEEREKAEKEKQEAIKAERERIEQQRISQQKEEERKMANKRHRSKILKDATTSLAELLGGKCSGLIQNGRHFDLAEDIISEIEAGRINRLQVNFS